MHGEPLAGQVVGLPHARVELEHAHEHGGHPLAVRDPVALDRGQRPFGVEALHQDDRAAQGVHRLGEAQRRRVVDRRGGQVHGVPVEAVQGDDARHHRGEFAHGTAGERFADPLGPSGGPGGVQHVVAARQVLGQGFVGGRGQCLVVGGEAVEGVTGGTRGGSAGEACGGVRGRVGVGGVAVDEPDADPGDVEPPDQVGQPGGDDQRPGPAVVHDVADLGRGEVAVDGGDVQARAQGRPVDLEGAQGVVRQQGDVVVGAQAAVVQETCQAS